MNTRFGLSDKTSEAIRLVLSRHPEVEQAVLFGSRAKGNFKPGSDIDLALLGSGLTQRILNRIYEELDDLPIPYQFSLILSATITDLEIIAHINRVGALFYEKEHLSVKR